MPIHRVAFACVLLTILSLLPQQAAAQVLLDHLSRRSPPSVIGVDGPNERWAKEFEPTSSGVIATVELWMRRSAGSGSFTIEIHRAGLPSPSRLLGSGTGTAPADLTLVTVPISGSIPVVAGASYFAVLIPSAGESLRWQLGGVTETSYFSDTSGDGWRLQSVGRPTLRVNGVPLSANGVACSEGTECMSDFCVDGVCCGSSCGGGSGDCQACSVAAGGTGDGDCTPLSAGLAAATTCHASTGLCDPAEVCSPASTSCPADILASAGTVCRPVAASCDAAELCSGASASCPTDVDVADGTDCGDGVTCNGAEVCGAGTCEVPGALDCDDSDACTADSCAEPGGCAHDSVAGCCNVDADCPSLGACATNACDVSTHLCVSVPVADCCAFDVDCDDGDACTTDVCDATTGGCSNAPMASCGDAGVEPADGGVEPADGGVEPEDGGVDAGDGGVDAGDLEDGGVEDGGDSVDGGTVGDGASGGCACAMVGVRGPSSPLGLLVALGLAGALVRRRRARRVA